MSACLVVLVIRTRKPFFASRPGLALAVSTALVVAGTLALPYTPLANLMGLRPLPPSLLAALGIVVGAYVGTAELAKRRYVWR